jgi:hypothetical protein
LGADLIQGGFEQGRKPMLFAWLRLAGTRSVDEIAAAIRSFRAS